MKRCKALSVSALRQLMDLSEPLAELNRERFQTMEISVQRATTPSPV